MKLFLALLVAGVALLVANGNITFYWLDARDTQAAPPAQMDTPTVRDVLAILGAATPDATDLDNAQMNGLLTRVATTADESAVQLLERELSTLAPRIDRRIRLLIAEVADQRVTTMVGRECRATTVRFLGRQRVLFRRFGSTVARRGATRSGVMRLLRDNRRLQESYSSNVASCTAGATPEERAAIESAFQG